MRHARYPRLKPTGLFRDDSRDTDGNHAMTGENDTPRPVRMLKHIVTAIRAGKPTLALKPGHDLRPVGFDHLSFRTASMRKYMHNSMT